MDITWNKHKLGLTCKIRGENPVKTHLLLLMILSSVHSLKQVEGLGNFTIIDYLQHWSFW